MKKLVGQMARFVSVGGVGVLLYYLVLYVLTDKFGVWYLTSSVIASVVNQGSNFVLHKMWTFRSKALEHVGRETGLYAMNVAALFIINTAALYVLVEYGHFQYLVAQVIATVLVTIINFFTARWIFTH